MKEYKTVSYSNGNIREIYAGNQWIIAMNAWLLAKRELEEEGKTNGSYVEVREFDTDCDEYKIIADTKEEWDK